MFGKGGGGGVGWGGCVFSQSRLLKMSSCKTPISEKLSDASGGKAGDSSSGILHQVPPLHKVPQRAHEEDESQVKSTYL